MGCGERVREELQRATKRFLLRIVFAWSLSYWSFTRLFSVREVAAKIITALKAMTRPYAKCHNRPAPSPAPHRLAGVQCSLCALLVSIAKSCVLEVCCCPPLTPVFPCHSHLNFALRRFAVFRVRAFHTKKCKIRAKFTSNVELTGSWWWLGTRGRGKEEGFPL